jgi:hypothetical protein
MKKTTQLLILLILFGSLILSGCQTIKDLSVRGAQDLPLEFDSVSSFFSTILKITKDVFINIIILGLLLSIIPGLNGFGLGSLIALVGYWYYIVDNRDYGFWVVLAIITCVSLAATILNALIAIITTKIMTMWYLRKERNNQE